MCSRPPRIHSSSGVGARVRHGGGEEEVNPPWPPLPPREKRGQPPLTARAACGEGPGPRVGTRAGRPGPAAPRLWARDGTSRTRLRIRKIRSWIRSQRFSSALRCYNPLLFEMPLLYSSNFGGWGVEHAVFVCSFNFLW